MSQREKWFNPVSSAAFRAILLISLCWSIAAYGDAKSDCDAITGGIHTRVAWVEGGDGIKGGSKGISGFDSKTGKVTKIYDGACVKCVMCCGGNKVLFTSGDYKVWIIDFDGKNAKQLTDAGSVTDGWRDPKTGTEWAVFRGHGQDAGGGIHRINIDDPTQKIELYGDKAGHKVYAWFQMSADGTFAAAFIPYSDAYVYDIVNKKKTKIKTGQGDCWASTASDNSYNWFHCEHGHRELTLYTKTETFGKVRVVPPETEGSTYCPRLAEGTKETGLFFTIGGGYTSYSSTGIEIYLGKFSSDLKSVEKWARITNDDVANHHSSVWVGVESGETSLESNRQTSTSQFFAKRVGAKTFDFSLRQKDFFEMEIVNPMGLVVEKSSMSGLSRFRWSGQTTGAYIIRLTGKNGELTKRVTLW